MKFRFLNKVIEHKRFEYTPMYYDERKERLAKKVKQHDTTQYEALSDVEKREIFKENLRDNWSSSKVRQQGRKSANVRTLVLIALIVALGYFIFNGLDQVDSIVNRLW